MLDQSFRAVVASKFPDRPTAVINRQIDEVVKFLTLISTSPSGRFIPMSRDADEVWHEMIVQTRHYMDFCAELPGKGYIHHQSIGFEEYADKIGRRAAVTQFVGWIPEYFEKFGPFTEDTAQDWAVVDFLRREVGMSLDQVNALAQTVATSA